VKRLLVDETGSLDTRLYLVKVSGLRVSDAGLCDRKYAPVLPAAIVIMAMPTQRFFGDGGADFGEAVEAEAKRRY
jgi:hypothetical protein